MARIRAKARTKRVVGRLLNRLARGKTKVVKVADRLPNRLARGKTKVVKVADRLPNRLVSQVKSMGRLMRRPASRERITVTAGNRAADRVRARARTNRRFSYLLLLIN